tara:strand:+ start:1941 stop:2876 length:936 start_codon:yes stop_codon:yes gene_type:complete
MSNIFLVVLGVFGYIVIGYTIGKLKIFPNYLIRWFDFTSFNILLPLALIAFFWKIEFPNINIFNLMFSFFGSGILIFMIGFFISLIVLKLKTDDSALMGLGSCFGNSVALGIPLMYSLLGPVNSMPYMILVFFHGFIHFTYTTLIIEGYRNRDSSLILIILKSLIGIFKNIVLLGMIIGIVLNYSSTEPPEILNVVLDILTKFSLPAVLISLGLSLSNFKISEYFTFSLILTSLKNFIHPVIAFILAKYFFSMSPTLVFIVTLAAALPSGSQTYYFSYRYDALKQIISSNIVLSTFVSFITIPVILFLFGY